MTDRMQLGKAIRFIAWGYVLIYLDINLGTLNILPNWLGLLLILHALSAIAREVPTAALLRPFAILLAAWDGIGWLAKLFHITVGVNISIVSLIASVITLYFHFQLLTDLAALSEKYDCPQTKRLLHLRTVNTLLATALSLPLPWEKVEWLAIVTLLVYGVIVIWICVVLFGLKHALTESEEEEEAPE